MSSVFRSLAVALTAAAVFVGIADAQPAQSLKDAWLATNGELLALDEGALVAKFDSEEDPPAFKAIAFERPTLGTGALEVRGLIAVDGTAVYRFETNTPGVAPRFLFNAATEEPALRYVTAVAVTDDGHLLISGYSRPKRVFEIWEVELPDEPGELLTFWRRASSTPQITDAVYVRAEDVTGGPLAGGGLLATAGKQVLFFPKDPPAPALPFTTVVVLADAKSLALKGATDLTSVDLVKRTGMLMIATTERTLLTRSANLLRDTVSSYPFATVVPPSASAPVANCHTLRTQRLIVRNAQGGDETSTFVADSACQQLVRYDVTEGQLTTANNTADDYDTWSAPLTALAIGEGNAIECTNSQLPNPACELISESFTARINATETTQLLVLEFPDLCDPRVNTACVEDITGDPIDDDGTLHLNQLLPASFQQALTVDITIPGYMFSSRRDGRFGVVFIQADEVSDDAGATIHLEIAQLAGDELGVAEGLPRLPDADLLRVLNQDVAAYAPDNPLWDTVRGFEATPITTGSGSMEADMRGFSAVIYGLVHDVWEPIQGQASERADPAGIQTLNTNGSTPGAWCDLDLVGSQQYYHPDEGDSEKYFLNLIACLFTDEELLLTTGIPGPTAANEGYPALETSLNQVKDKLIKALSGAGPNTGSETFSALLSQLDQFDAAVAATPFAGLQIYKNELLVRSKVLRFNIKERAIPSIPIGGF